MSSTARNIQSGCDPSKARAAACITAAPFEEFLAAEFPPLPRVSSSQQLVRESDQNVLILHSSGTTGGYESHDSGHPSTADLFVLGLPKAIPLAHRYLLGYAACHLFPPDEDEYSRGINLSTLPLYHVRPSMNMPRRAILILSGVWCAGPLPCPFSGQDSLFPSCIDHPHCLIGQQPLKEPKNIITDDGP